MNFIIEKCFVIQIACVNDCKNQLLNDLLVYFKISFDKRVKFKLVQVSCQANFVRNYEIVEILLNVDFIVNDACLVIEKTSLMIVARHENFDMMNLLIFNETNSHALNKNDCNVIHYVCKDDHLSSLQLFKNFSVDWSRKTKCSFFYLWKIHKDHSLSSCDNAQKQSYFKLFYKWKSRIWHQYRHEFLNDRSFYCDLIISFNECIDIALKKRIFDH